MCPVDINGAWLTSNTTGVRTQEELLVPELAKVAPLAKAWKDAGIEKIYAWHATAMARVAAQTTSPTLTLDTANHVSGLDSYFAFTQHWVSEHVQG